MLVDFYLTKSLQVDTDEKFKKDVLAEWNLTDAEVGANPNLIHIVSIPMDNVGTNPNSTHSVRRGVGASYHFCAIIHCPCCCCFAFLSVLVIIFICVVIVAVVVAVVVHFLLILQLSSCFLSILSLKLSFTSARSMRILHKNIPNCCSQPLLYLPPLCLPVLTR